MRNDYDASVDDALANFGEELGSIVPAPVVDADDNSGTIAGGASEAQRHDHVVTGSRDGRPDLRWNDSVGLRVNFDKLGEVLAHKYQGELFRPFDCHRGLVLVRGNGDVVPIQKGGDLSPLIVDRVRVEVVRGETVGERIASADLTNALGSQTFLDHFAVVSSVCTSPLYTEEFELTKPGYNPVDGGGIVYVGTEAKSRPGTGTLDRFLDHMSFASEVDRTNAVGGGVTSDLRFKWPGGKPIIIVTSNRSHAGKDTVLDFIRHSVRSASISYQSADWALERAFVIALQSTPDAGVITVDNARIDRRSDVIASAFLERFVTDKAPLLSTLKGKVNLRRRNEIVVAVSTNEGSVNEDLLNRSLLIHLEPVGDVNARVSEIGNPRHEYLPKHMPAIREEFRGLIERWKREGMPRANIRHSFSEWASVVGGILEVAGYKGFLANHNTRGGRDPIRRGLSLLGLASPDIWLTASDWSNLAVRLGLVKTLVTGATDQTCEAGRSRSIGLVLTAHREEHLVIESDDAIVKMRLEKARRRFESGSEASTRYRFVTVERRAIPVDGTDEEKVVRL